MYLWNENVSPREHESAYAQHWQESLAAIRKIKNIYPQFINRVHGLETYVDADNFELALLGMEKSIENFLNGKDFRKPGRKRPPEDKVNRVIFTLYEYLKQQTRGPPLANSSGSFRCCWSYKNGGQETEEKLQDTRQSGP